MRIQTNSPAPSTTTFKILPTDGVFPTASPFAGGLPEVTVQIDANSLKWYSADFFSYGILVSPDDLWALAFLVGSLSIPVDLDNGYAGGRVVFKDSNTPWSAFSDRDMLFRTYVYPIPPGDFNKDLNVDDDDLAIWETHYGVDDGADANGDGISDGQDFLIWQRNIGMMASFFAASAAVPEPTTYTLALAALCLAMSRRRVS